ncbi:MAG: DedA family protein [Acidimicrobiia bacterium]
MIFAGISEFVTGDLTDWVIGVIETIGYLGVAFLVSLENVFPPIPSEVVLPLAGFTASQGDATLWGMILAATAGSVVGAWILYGISAAIGPVRLRAFILRYSRWFGIKATDLDRSEAWFDDHSGIAVLVCRCIPLIRSLVSLPAGFRRMNLVSFTLYTAIGSAVWNVLLIGAGYLLGDRWDVVGQWIDVLQYIVIAAILGLLGWWVWTRFISSQARTQRAAASRSEGK